MLVIYIASPYSLADTADMEFRVKNVRVQMDAANLILDLGHCPIAPLMSHFLQLLKARPYEDWLEMCTMLVRRSDIVLRLPGDSPGADREVAHAIKHNILVAYGWDELYRLIGAD